MFVLTLSRYYRSVYLTVEVKNKKRPGDIKKARESCRALPLFSQVKRVHAIRNVKKCQQQRRLRSGVEVLFQRTTNSITIVQVERVNTFSGMPFHFIYFACSIRSPAAHSVGPFFPFLIFKLCRLSKPH